MRLAGILSILFLFLLALQVNAQKAKLVTAKINYEQGDYEIALTGLNEVLEEPQGFGDDDISDAYYYKGLTLVRLFNLSSSSNDPEMAQKYGNSLLNAHKAFEKAKELAEERSVKKIDKEISNLYYPLLQVGLSLMNYSYTEGLDQNAVDGYLALSQEYLEQTLEIGEDYLPYDLLGQVMLLTGDSIGASENFIKSIEWYERKKPAEPDMLTGYAFYRLALIERYYFKTPEVALSTLEEGIALLDSEFFRLETEKSGYERAKLDEISQHYSTTKADLDNFRLDIMMNDPELLEKSLVEFEKAIRENPRDYNKIVAYAGLLEQTDMEKAIEMYLKASTVDTSNDIAWFNLGVIYNNKAIEYLKFAKNTASTGNSIEYEKMANAELETSADYFKKALERDPNSLEVVTALKNIYLRLGNMDEWKVYDEKEKELSSF
ncbi:MAG: hypothetical protein K8R53_06545 [Bacteroidales bacterium]|nr:hypothetical protein [Bacteroidales bacterium]